MKRAIIYIFFSLGLFTGCKKAKLDADLTGEWIWSMSNDGQGRMLTPATEGYTLKLELIQKGKYVLRKNGAKVEHGKMEKTNGFFSFNCFRFSVDPVLNGFLIVKPDNDTLIIGDVPLDAATDAGYMYFIKN